MKSSEVWQKMTFDLDQGPAGQTYKLVVGFAAPRPIALITTMDEDGNP